MFEDFEKKLNHRLLDFIIWGSYLGDRGENFFVNIKKIAMEAYEHLLAKFKEFQRWYRE